MYIFLPVCEKISKISENNLYFESFFGNILRGWVKALENNEEDSFKFYNKIPERYDSLKKIQNSFLQCYFDKSETEITFKQLISNKETGFTHFEFSDSLINGSMKAYRDMCVELKAVNNQLNDKITWAGQFICRSERQMPEEDWELTASAGAKELIIGVETGSEEVRMHMRKKFTNDDMWFTFKMAKKYNIRVTVLTIVGYPTETDKDFQETLNMVKTINEINDGTGLIRVSVGQSMKILSNTPIYDMANDMGITKGKLDWTYKDNTRKVRLRRLIDLLELTKKHGHRQGPYIEARLPALIKEYSNI